MKNLSVARMKSRRDYLFAIKHVFVECREVKKEISSLPPLLLKLLFPSLVAKLGCLMCDYEREARTLQHKLFDDGKHLTVCTAVYRSVLTRFIQKFDAYTASDEFGQLIILPNLDCVPQLVEFFKSCICSRPIGPTGQ
jgi:hypothetical protein